MFRRVWLGSLFLLLGLGILFHQMGVWDFKYILRTWWPLILVIIGVGRLINQRQSSHIVSFMLILIGGLLLINQWIDINVTAFIWPLIFIFIGLTIIFSQRKQKTVPNSGNLIEAFALFGGSHLRSQSTNLEGGRVMAVFGGAEIDLRDANISEQGAIFELTAAFGGVNIIVPENVRIEVSGLPIFGGWEDKTRRTAKGSETSVIKINCLALFGGIEIKD